MKERRLMQRTILRLVPLLLFVSLGIMGCSRNEPVTEPATPNEQQKRAERAAEMPEATQVRWTFLNRLRQQEPFDTIDRTLVDGQSQLGVVLDPGVTPDKATALMKQVMTEMAREFPREDITLIVYESSTPLRKLGTARLDGKTGEVIYTPAQ